MLVVTRVVGDSAEVRPDGEQADHETGGGERDATHTRSLRGAAVAGERPPQIPRLPIAQDRGCADRPDRLLGAGPCQLPAGLNRPSTSGRLDPHGYVGVSRGGWWRVCRTAGVPNGPSCGRARAAARWRQARPFGGNRAVSG